MELKIQIPSYNRIPVDILVDLSFVFYFSSPLLKAFFLEVLSFVNLSAWADCFVIWCIYFPVLVAVAAGAKHYVKLDFLLLLSCIAAFFFLTLCIHPEYYYYYARSDYGIWDYVFIPTEAIYAYLFVRLMDKAERFERNMRTSGWLMFIYFAMLLIQANRRGYWLGISGTEVVEMDHSVAMGYEVLLFALVFIYYAFTKKRKSDFVAAAISMILILSAGARGALLFALVFILLMLFRNVQNIKQAVLWAVIIGGLGFLFIAYYNEIIVALIRLMEGFGGSTRILEQLLENSIADDNGRDRIWSAAIQMIQEQPLGYGAMGSQHQITNYILAGYPHSVVLEILIDFGVLFGSIILFFLAWHAFNTIFRNKKVPWSDVCFIFFGTACQLFISLCYWSSVAFWACIGATVNLYVSKREGKARQRRLS